MRRRSHCSVSMADYFFLLDAASFEGAARPRLAESWQQRSFAPCRKLCGELTAAARAYYLRYHVGEGEPLVSLVAQGLPFDRSIWRLLVSEVLLFSAAEIPELQTCPDTLCCILAPECYRDCLHQRHELA